MNRFTRIIFPILAILVLLSLGCKDKDNTPPEPQQRAESTQGWDRAKAELEYQLIQAETKLINSEKVYLVIDLKNSRLVLKLKGATVWSSPMKSNESSQSDLEGFARKFVGNRNRLIRPMTEKHLFSAIDKTPDSVLAIISGAVKASVETLQREVPQRFMVSWGPNLSLEVRSDVAGQPTSTVKNVFVDFRQALSTPLGAARLVINMEPEDALTLYRATRTGLPTLIYPAL